MNLQEIAQLVGAEAPAGAYDLEVADLAYDSRRVGPGALFFCIRGSRQDGHALAQDAVRAGAVALVTDSPVELAEPVPRLQVADTRAAMNAAAAAFFGHPSRRVAVAGVTGTNGKTTTTFLLESIFRATGEPAGLIGTVEVHLGRRVEGAGRTTPEAVDLQRMLAEMAAAGVTRCAVEVTSIGIDSGRVEGLELAAAVFTNLTHDHLDHHGTMERYYASKARIFHRPLPGAAIVNADDPFGRRLAAELPYTALRYGLHADADVAAVDVVAGRRGSRFRAVGCGLDLALEVRLPGRFNVSNALAAAAAALKMGVPEAAIADGIRNLERVPGRFEPVDEGQPFLVVVDYAHTPDALANVLAAAREAARGRVIVVFGCGGDRDRAKRPRMGRVAGELGDLVLATSDNPRGEDPLAILREVQAGLDAARPSAGYEVEPDRAEAIRRALEAARAEDVVVIAGKGHETGQQVGDEVLPFDDRRVAAAILRELA